MPLADAFPGGRMPAPAKKIKKPVWAGPESDAPNGGITFSLLSRFLCCRERFRLRVVEGLRPAETFNHRIEYGNMWHVCEEALAKGAGQDTESGWPFQLAKYATGLCRKYPLAQADVEHWYNVCLVQFPVYVEYWKAHPDVVDRTPLLQEHSFRVPYRLPSSGRSVHLRGKWDSVDVIGKGKDAGIYLQENKTKGDVDETQLRRQLTFDLQTMMYVVALGEAKEGSDPDLLKLWSTSPIQGVRYNVVRRPLSGGEGSIVQKKGSKNVRPETADEYYGRVRGVIDGTGINSKGENYTGPSHFFMRFKVEVTPADVAAFRRECLDPILENLLDWWDEVNPPAKQVRPANYRTPMNWRHPFGVWNVLDEGGSSDVDAYLMTGSESGLTRSAELFPELT